MAREYQKNDIQGALALRRHNIAVATAACCLAPLFLSLTGISGGVSPGGQLLLSGFLPAAALSIWFYSVCQHAWIERERRRESELRGGKQVLGLPPDRTAFEKALEEVQSQGKVMIDRYLVGFEVDSGKPIWVSDEELCGHGAVFAKTGVGKTLWLEGLMFQQMARGRASGFTFIDAKRDPGTLADIIMMALLTGRIEDLVVVDPFDPVCAYNFVFTTQRADVKARKVLRCGLPPTSDQSTTKHYDRLAADAIYRVVRAMESLGLAWSVRDIAVALSAFQVAYPRLRALLSDHGSKQAMVELGHLASSYRTAKGSLDSARLTDNLRGIASELHSIANSEAGEMFCMPKADLSLTDAILRGKMIYYMLPRLEEAESAARMVKVFREDLEVSIGEVTSSRHHKLEDPHMVIIDEGASTFGPTWANLFELARKGRFALLFGAQSVGGLMDQQMGLSEEFYERVMANVNLKVIMRIGDNRTAMDMSEWIGMVKTAKKSLSTGITSGVSAHELTKNIEINRRSSDSFRDAITIADDEEELVSPEELKHEMSAEKGLAWFDKGDGILRKGRSIWFDSDLPGTWQGREFLTRYESVEADEVGLAEWVDEHILSIEQAESERHGQSEPGAAPAPAAAGESVKEEETPPPGNFRLNLLRPLRGRRPSATFTAAPKEKPSEPPVEPDRKGEQILVQTPVPKKITEEHQTERPHQSLSAPQPPPPRAPSPPPPTGASAPMKKKEAHPPLPSHSGTLKSENNNNHRSATGSHSRVNVTQTRPEGEQTHRATVAEKGKSEPSKKGTPHQGEKVQDAPKGSAKLSLQGKSRDAVTLKPKSGVK